MQDKLDLIYQLYDIFKEHDGPLTKQNFDNFSTFSLYGIDNWKLDINDALKYIDDINGSGYKFLNDSRIEGLLKRMLKKLDTYLMVIEYHSK